jgi:hypothetical protein
LPISKPTLVALPAIMVARNSQVSESHSHDHFQIFTWYNHLSVRPAVEVLDEGEYVRLKCLLAVWREGGKSFVCRTIKRAEHIRQFAVLLMMSILWVGNAAGLVSEPFVRDRHLHLNHFRLKV